MSAYGSVQLNDLYAAVDEGDVKVGPKYYTRERGEPKDAPLTRTKGVDGRARRWMVDPEWLEANKSEDTHLTLLDNGKLWGDLDDPDEIKDIQDATRQKKAVARAAKRKAEESGLSMPLKKKVARR